MELGSRTTMWKMPPGAGSSVWMLNFCHPPRIWLNSSMISGAEEQSLAPRLIPNSVISLSCLHCFPPWTSQRLLFLSLRPGWWRSAFTSLPCTGEAGGAVEHSFLKSYQNAEVHSLVICSTECVPKHNIHMPYNLALHFTIPEKVYIPVRLYSQSS